MRQDNTVLKNRKTMKCSTVAELLLLEAMKLFRQKDHQWQRKSKAEYNISTT